MKLSDRDGNVCFGLRVTEKMMEDPTDVLLFIKENSSLGTGTLLKTSEIFLVGGEIESISGEKLVFDSRDIVTFITKDDIFIIGNGYTDCVKEIRLLEDYQIEEI